MAEFKKKFFSKKKGFFSGIDWDKAINVYDADTWNQQNPPRANSPEDDKVRIGNKQKEQERIRIKQLSIARDGAKKLGKKNYVWLISIGVAVLSYNFAKSNKEFYAFVGLLSPALIMISKSKYEKIVRDKKMKIERERRNSLAQA